MTRLRLNWLFQLCALAAIACGSSKNDGGVGNGNSAVGGGNGSAVGGNGYSNGGKNGTAGSGNNTNGGMNTNGGANGNAGNNAMAGNGVAGSNTWGGNGSGTGSTSGISDGGTGEGAVGGSGSDATGGAFSVDVKVTGGSGNTVDFGTGGGNSTDFATGGGWSIDTATGGGNSIDVATGGGGSIDVATGGGGSIDVATGGGSSIDKATGGGSSVGLGTGGGSSIDHGCFVTTLGDINVYAIKDATPSGADTEGKLYVGGNLTANGYSVGAKAGVDCTKYSLVVGGNVSLTGGTVRAGKAVYAGTSGTVNSTAFPDCGGLTRGRPIDFTALEAEVEDLSTKLAALPSTDCTVTVNGSGLTITATNPTFSVCNVDGSTLPVSGGVSQLGAVSMTFPAGSSVAVNVSGTAINWAGAAVCLNGQCADSAQANQVVWNLYQATSLSASGIAIEGSILAPLATLSGGGGHIAGQVIVKYLTGGLEYHPYMFSGCIKWPTTL